MTTAMTSVRLEHSMVSYGNHLIVAGGSDASVVYNSVLTATISPNGTVGTWSATTSLPTELTALATIVSKDHLFVIGGYHRPFNPGGGQSTVFSAPLSSDGTLGAWSATTSLPTDLYRTGVVAFDRWIYVIGGFSDTYTAVQSQVWRAEVFSNGTLSAWTSVTALPVALHGHDAVVVGSRIFVLGGMTGAANGNSNAVYSAVVNQDGSLGAWTAATPLPQATVSMGVVVLQNRIVVVGGEHGASGTEDTADVYIGKVDANGTITQWETGQSLPMPMSYFGLATYNNYILMSGGMNNAALQNATYTSAFTSSTSTALSISHIEISQVIQNETNTIPLIAGKPTLVRVYVDCGIPDCFERGITGFIRPSNGGFPISPTNGSGITIYHEDWVIQRKEINKTLNFILPPAWLSGQIDLNVEVGETVMPLQLSFQQGQQLRIGYIGLPFKQNNQIYTPDIDLTGASRLANAIYPVANNIEYIPQGMGQALDAPFSCTTLANCPALNYFKELLRFWKITTSSNGWNHNLIPDRLIGWLPPQAGGHGWCGFADSKLDRSDASGLVAVGIAASGRNCYGWSIDETLAHEIGHLLNDNELRHAYGCRGNGPDPSYPNQNGKIESTVWGVDIQTLTLFDPSKTYDFMSYCKPVWISEYNYRKLLTGFISGTPTPMPLMRPADVQRVILVSGTVNNPAAPSVIFDPFYPFTSQIAPDSSTGTTYCLEMHNLNEIPLDSRCFDLSFKAPESGDATTSDIFVKTLPYPPETQSIVMTYHGQEIGRVTLSGHAPTVQLVSPNGGQVWDANGTYPVTWTASDADNDPLRFILYYSPDNGISWKPIALDATGTSVNVKAAHLMGSTSALFKIVATDQMNTAEDVSDAPFIVEAKGPQVSITAPENNMTFELGASVLLQGSAYDLEDGTLSETALSWASSLDGDLGTGTTILPTLSLGQHLITLTATDSDSIVSAAEINVTMQQSILQSPSAAPMLLTPANAKTTNDNTPVFTWDTVAKSDAYRIQIDNNANFASPENTMDVGGQTYETISLADGLYYWRVRGLNAAGEGTWSAPLTLTIDTAPPDAPTLNDPPDGSTVKNLHPVFSWTKVRDAAQYEIQLDTVTPPVSSIMTSALTYTPPAPLIIATYHWRVRAIDLAGNPSEWSEARTVTIESPPNAQPPRHYVSSPPTLTWSRVTWAVGYEIQVDNTSTFSTTLDFTTTVDDATLWVDTSSLSDGTYYWRVRAKKQDGTWGAWSAPESFVLDAP